MGSKTSDAVNAEFFEGAAESLDQVLPGLTPGAVIDAMEDPKGFEAIARGDLYVQMAHMRRAAAHPEFPAAHRMEYVKLLARMGKVDMPDRTQMDLDAIPGINIIFPGGAQVSIGRTVQPMLPKQPEKDITPPRPKPHKAVLPR